MGGVISRDVFLDDGSEEVREELFDCGREVWREVTRELPRLVGARLARSEKNRAGCDGRATVLRDDDVRESRI